MGIAKDVNAYTGVVRVSREEHCFRVELEGKSEDVVKMLKELRLKAAEIKKFVDSEARDEQTEETLRFNANTPLTDAIMTVLHSKRGRRPMTLGEITDALKQGGAFYAPTSISSVLTSLSDRGKIRRWKEQGKYLHHRAGDPEVG